MSQLEAEWPTKRDLSPPPHEERRKDVVTVAAALSNTDLKVQYNCLITVVGVFGYVFQAIRKWKAYKRDDGQRYRGLPPKPSREERKAEEWYLIEEAQRGINLLHLKSLLPVKHLITRVSLKQSNFFFSIRSETTETNRFVSKQTEKNENKSKNQIRTRHQTALEKL
jgi:hypothetical protein